MSDADGNIIGRARYSAWGKVLFENTTRHAPKGFEQNLRMQGQYDDRECGLYYNTFRYYDADSGRFTTEDPIGLNGGDNLYQYAPNALMWIDPWGWWTVKIGGYVIRVHANDVDPWPSTPHGHIYDKGYVIDTGGKIFDVSSRNQVGQLSKKDTKLWKQEQKKHGC